MDGGRIAEQGSYSELIENGKAFAEFIRTYANVDNTEGKHKYTTVSATTWSIHDNAFTQKVGLEVWLHL